MIRRRFIPLLCAAALIGPAGSAYAQDGVTFDAPNNSPAQKEYAIPLDQARKDASGGDSDTAPAPSSGASSPATDADSGSSPASAPLFGRGIGDDAGQAVKDKSSASHGGAKAPSGNAPSSVNSALASTRASTAVTSNQGGGALTIGAVAFALLLLGGVLGSIVNRRSS